MHIDSKAEELRIEVEEQENSEEMGQCVVSW